MRIFLHLYLFVFLFLLQISCPYTRSLAENTVAEENASAAELISAEKMKPDSDGKSDLKSGLKFNGNSDIKSDLKSNRNSDGNSDFIDGNSEKDVKIDENLVIFASDMHFAPAPLVRYAVPVTENGRETVDYTYEKTGRPGETRVEIDTQSNLRALVSEVLQMNPRPACVILLGDDVQEPEKKQYEAVRNTLRPWEEAGIRYIKIMGNHDHPSVTVPNEEYLQVFPETQCASISPSPRWQALRISLPAADFLVFETFDPLRNGYETWFTPSQMEKYGKKDTYLRYYGAFFPEQYTWLKSVLESQPSDRPIFFCGHHLVDFDAFLPEYHDFPQLEGWIHGHFHKFYLPKELGIRAVSLPSSGVLGVGVRQTPPSYVKMEILRDSYRFTLQTYDKNAPENGNTFEFLKHKLK